LNTFEKFSENYSNIKFHKISSSGSRVVPCGQEDERTNGLADDEANIRFLQFCEVT